MGDNDRCGTLGASFHKGELLITIVTNVITCYVMLYFFHTVLVLPVWNYVISVIVTGEVLCPRAREQLLQYFNNKTRVHIARSAP